MRLAAGPAICLHVLDRGSYILRFHAVRLSKIMLGHYLDLLQMLEFEKVL